MELFRLFVITFVSFLATQPAAELIRENSETELDHVSLPLTFSHENVSFIFLLPLLTYWFCAYQLTSHLITLKQKLKTG